MNHGELFCVTSGSTMANDILESNRLAGTRLELLLFSLGGRQQYGINVFKVQEVIPFQPLTKLPGAHPLVDGVATMRGVTMPVIDLSRAMGGIAMSEPEKGNVIITEYNRSVHGFLVQSVDRIVNTRWEKVKPRPVGIGKDSFVTAITQFDNIMVEILDVEKVLDQVVDASTSLSQDLADRQDLAGRQVLIVDDSLVARNQIKMALQQIGVECMTAHDGKEAIDLLEELENDGVDIVQHFDMVISDIEMPEMDGYMLTKSIRAHKEWDSLYILLHSSISGEFNEDMVKKTGANRFIQKYDANDLARAVLEHT